MNECILHYGVEIGLHTCRMIFQTNCSMNNIVAPDLSFDLLVSAFFILDGRGDL